MARRLLKSKKNYLKSTETPNEKIKTVVKQLKTKKTQENFETEMINFILHFNVLKTRIM